MLPELSARLSGRLAWHTWLCDNHNAMRMRGVLVIIVLLSLVVAPVATAVDGCSGMGAVCGALCSAPCVSASPSTGDAILSLVAALVPTELSSVPAGVLQVLDAPPKSLLA